MSSWVGFTDRLRRHALSVNATTRGYLYTAADRIEDLENKLLAAQDQVSLLDHTLFQLRKNNS